MWIWALPACSIALQFSQPALDQIPTALSWSKYIKEMGQKEKFKRKGLGDYTSAFTSES